MSAPSHFHDGATVSRAVGADVFLDEYSRDDVIAKYVSSSAGTGIAHALTHVYGPVYLDVIKTLIAQRSRLHRFRALEYGCGGAMNLLKLLELLRQQGVAVDAAVGADFSRPMVEAARHEAARHLPVDLATQVHFAIASNETLVRDVANNLGCRAEEIEGSFDIVVGVNTFRYCHRIKRENDCAEDLFKLLGPGGYSIMIDMNRRFPLFRSKLTDRLRRRPEDECYLPSLEEYTRPFELAGFRIAQSRNLCWLPHSAGPGLVAVCRALAPLLDRWCSPFAMRSLVVAQKPG